MNAAGIAAALKGKRAGSGRWLARCPAHADRTPSLSLREGVIGPLVHCHAGCLQRDVIDALRERGLWPSPPSRSSRRPPSPSRAVRRDNQQWRQDTAARIWNASHDPRGTVAEDYLNSRGLRLDDDLAGRVIKFHPTCPWGEGTKAPCLIAAFRPIQNDPGEDAPPSAILRVGLDEHGAKLGKKMLGPVSGCAIKHDRDENVTLGLGITEGLETGLAVRATGWRPVWALGSAGAIATFPVLAGIETLTLFADHDPTGLSAAQRCAERWQAAGCEVFIRWPKGLGRDYADEVSR